LSGAAIIAATQPVPDNFDLSADPATPLPVLLIHGTKDPLVPYDGGMASLWGFRPRGLGRSAPETAEY
jgi:polyhydroxybutyrate depolymerase